MERQHVGSGPRYRVFVRHDDGVFRMDGTIGGPWDWFENALEFTQAAERRYPGDVFRITAFASDIVYETQPADADGSQ